MPQPVTLTARNDLQLARKGTSTNCAVNCLQIPEGAAACITVELLGRLRVRAGRRTLGPRELGGAKVRRVFIALLLQRGAPVSKEQLISLVWEGSPSPGAKATLESYVCVLRKTLQPFHETRSSLIMTVADGYAMDMSRVDLDLARYEALLSAALRTDVAALKALPMLERAMTLAGAPLLPDELDCEWLDEARRLHHHGVQKAMIAAANKVAGLAPARAELWARLALKSNPLDESAWHALLRSMETSGQHADGLAAYHHCRRLFAAELGCAPGPGLQALYVQLLRGANESNLELSQLFDALVRVHEAIQTETRPSSRVDLGERRDADVRGASVDEACLALELLLNSVGVSRHHLATGSVA